MERVTDGQGGEYPAHALGDEQHHRHIDGEGQKARCECGAARALGVDLAPHRQVGRQQQRQQSRDQKKRQHGPEREIDHVEDQLQQAGDRSRAQGAHVQFSPMRVGKGLLTTLTRFTGSS